MSDTEAIIIVILDFIIPTVRSIHVCRCAVGVVRVECGPMDAKGNEQYPCACTAGLWF